MHFVATQYKKILQETQVYLNRTQEHKHQTANRTIYYLSMALKDLKL